MKRRHQDGGKGKGHGGTPLWPFLLVALAGAVYIGVQFAVNLWHSWLLAGAIVAAGIAVFWLIWPGESEI